MMGRYKMIETWDEVTVDGVTLKVGDKFTTQGSGVTGTIIRIDDKLVGGKPSPNMFAVCLNVAGNVRWTTVTL